MNVPTIRQYIKKNVSQAMLNYLGYRSMSAPIDLQYLIGWWPLNGNANDYSGNDNDGVQANVTFYSTYPST